MKHTTGDHAPNNSCPSELADLHLQAFVDSFVNKEKRARWRTFLTQRKESTLKESAKLQNHLDRNFCSKITLEKLDNNDSTGVFYDFFSPPIILSQKSAIDIGAYTDAIFSILPGKLAIYFYHEGYGWQCKKI